MSSILARICFLTLGLAAAADGGVLATNEIVSESDLAQVIGCLDDPATASAARQTLIKFSGMFLYEHSVYFSTGDRTMDHLRRTATKTVHAHRNIETVTQALGDVDADVRFWGVMGFVTTYGQTGPWEPLLPRLMSMASEDPDSRIRREAIRRLRSYEDGRTFLRNLLATTKETEPDVLLMLTEFDSQRPEARSAFYARAIQILNNGDEAMRLHWLCCIYLNVSNPNTATMWRIEADPTLLDALRQTQQQGSDRAKDLATKILDSLTSANLENQPVQ